MLAGVSVDYYTRLERGDLSGASPSVLEALASALQLDEAERAHLLDLARNAGPGTRRERAPQPRLRPSVQRVLDALVDSPAYVRDARLNILAANDLGYALYQGVLHRDQMPVNLARFLFLDRTAPAFFLDWETVADDVVASLRTQTGRTPSDRALNELVGELAVRSDSFATLWARHNVRLHRSATKRLHNPVVGDVELTGDALELPADGLTLIAYTAEPGSPAAEAIRLLASWAAQPTTRNRAPVD